MKYCEFCGRQLQDEEQCTCEEAVAQKENAEKEYNPEKNADYSAMFKKYKIPIIVGVAIFAIILIISAITSAKINPFNADIISFTGVNGYGKVDIDTNALIEKVIGESPDNFSSEAFEWAEKHDELLAGIDYKIDNEENLSNGDEINVTFNFTDAAAEEFKSVTKTITVSGLNEVDKVDVFKNIDITFEGISGQGSVKITRKIENDAFMNSIQIKPGEEVNDGNLANGDKVEIVINCFDSYIEELEKVPAESSKTFTVSGLSEYAKANDLPMETINEFADKFVNAERAENAEETSSMFSYSKAEIYGIYFCEAKSGAFTFNDTELHILVNYIQYMNGKYHNTIYKHLIFEDILKSEDGTIDIKYEDGSERGTFTTNIEKYLSNLEQNYTVTKIN